MRLLLDSHVLLAITHGQAASLGRNIVSLLDAGEHEKVVSTASLWELAIKHRLDKLQLRIPLMDLPTYFLSLEYRLLDVSYHHAIEELEELPPTRDPFDRLLLAQCQVEGMKLVTRDRALAKHPLAWRDK
jgi:PIN domain nuclease of toxin-antitoxin system